jgi:RimJ/RimL family protein N-acetyltransferase/predicted N-acetyltransferase YhbS
MTAASFEPDYPLQTERLLLRPFRSDDLDALYAIHSDEAVVRYLYWEPRTRDEVRDALERKIGAHVARPGEALSMAATLRDDGTLIGDCTLYWSSLEHRQGEIGFVFNPAFQGRGYATEAARALLEAAFDGLRLHRVVGRLEARNRASAAVLERLGMRREAHLIENEYVKDEWQSEVVYALLEDEWRAQRLTIRPARAEESSRLREILSSAKGHWGYDPELLRGWVDAYDFGELFRTHEVLVADSGAEVVAWASVAPPVDGVAALDDLWVEPGWMGKGVGSRLFAVARRRAAELGATTMEWEAEPNALGFYERMGGRFVRTGTSEWGRTLDIMAVTLDN